MGSWVYAATLVAVVAMTLAEGLAEESEMSANAEKWAYVPETPTEDDRQKAATELIQKSKKGRWVHVPLGKTVDGVLQQEEILKAKILADATAARKASEKKDKAKKRDEKMQKRILNADDEKALLKTQVAKAKEKLVDVTASLSGSTTDYSAMKANMVMQKKLHTQLEKLDAKRRELNDLIEKDSIKKEKRKKTLIKQAEEASKAKAEAQILKIKDMMLEGGGNPVIMEKLLQKFKKHTENELKNTDDLRLKESRTFGTMQATNGKVQEVRKEVNELKAKTDVSMIDVKINKAKSALKSAQRTNENNHVKEINAKDKLSVANEKQDVADQTESRAVNTLQRNMKRAKTKQADVKTTEAQIVGKLTKATAEMKVYRDKLKEHKAESEKLLVVLEKAKAAAEKENAAKTNQTKMLADSDELKQKVEVAKKRIAVGAHDIAVTAARQKAAALGIDEAKAKKAAAGKSDSVDFSEMMQNAIKGNEDANLNYKKAKRNLKKNKKIEVEDAKKEVELKQMVQSNKPGVDARVDVQGPDMRYEVSQKAISKYSRKFMDAKVRKTENQQLVEQSSTRVAEKMENVKSDQVSAVRTAQNVKKMMAADKVSEAGAKKAEKIVQATAEASSKKASEQHDVLMKLEAEKKHMLRPELRNKRDAKERELAQVMETLESQKAAATKVEHMRKLAVRRTQISRLAMQKAEQMKQEVTVKINTKETDTKDDIKRKESSIASEKDSKADEKNREENELTDKNHEAARLKVEKRLMSVQQARANADAETLEASAAAMKASATRAETEEKTVTAGLLHSETSAHIKEMALTKAEKLRKESKDSLSTTLTAEAEAQKNAKIARSKANLAQAATHGAEGSVQEAEENLATRKNNMYEGNQKTAVMSQQLLDARAELASNKEALDKAWTLEEKNTLTEATQKSQAKVNKLTQDLDAAHARNEVLAAAYDHARIHLKEQETALATDKKRYAEVMRQEKMDLLRYSKERAGASVRAQKAADVLKRIDEQVGNLKLEVAQAKKRLAQAKKQVEETKAKAKADCDKEKALQAQASSAESEAAALKAAGKVKLDADETTEEANDAAAANADEAKTQGAVNTVEAAMSKSESALAATSAQIQALSGELNTVSTEEDGVAGAAFAQQTGGAQEERSVAKDKLKLMAATSELGASSEEHKNLVRGKKLGTILQGLVKHKESVSKKTHEAANKHVQLLTSEGAVKHHEKQKNNLKLAIEDAKSKTNDFNAKVTNYKEQLQSAREDMSAAMSKVNVEKLKLSYLNQKLEKAQEARSADAAAASTAPTDSPDQVTGSMDALQADASVSKIKDKIKTLQDGELKDAEDEASELEKNIRKVEMSLEEAQNNRDSNEALVDTSTEKLKELGTFKNQTTKADAAAEAAADKQSKLKKMLKSKEDKMSDLEDSLSHSGSKLIRAHQKVLYYRSQLKETKTLEESNEEAAEKEAKDEAKKKQIQDELMLAKSKENKEKEDIKLEKAKDERLKEILAKKKETADAMKAAADRAAQKEQEAVVQQKEAAETAKEEVIVQKEEAKPDPEHIEKVVGKFLNQIDIPKLVQKSKAAMAQIVLDHRGEPPAAEEDDSAKKTAAEKQEKAKAKEEADQKAAMEKALQEKKAAAEAGEKAKKKAADMAARMKAEAAAAQAAAQKVNKERGDAANTVTDLMQKLEQAKKAAEKAAEKGDMSALQKAEAHVKLAKMTLKAKAEQLKELTTAADDAKIQAKDEQADAAMKAKREVDAAEERAKETAEEAEKDVVAATKSTEETVNNNAPPSPAPGNARFNQLYQRAMDIVNNVPVPEDIEAPGPPPWAESKEKVGALVAKAGHVIGKIQAHNKVAKAAQAAAAKKAKEDAENAKLAQSVATAQSEELAAQADSAAEQAKAAADKVIELENQVTAAEGNNAPNLAQLMSDLDAAKAEEIRLRTLAEDELKKSTDSAKQGGAASTAAEGQAETQEELEKLKAENDEAKANLEGATAEEKKAEAEAKAAEAKKAAEAAAASGDTAAATAAAAAAQTAQTEANAASNAANKASAKAAGAKEKGKANAAGAGAAKIEKPKGNPQDSIPEVKAITPSVVEQVVDEHLRNIVTDAHPLTPKGR